MRRRPTHEEIMEIGDLGLEIFHSKIEHHLTDTDAGKKIAINVDTGEWSIGDDAFSDIETRDKDARIINFYYPHPGPYAVGITAIEDE